MNALGTERITWRSLKHEPMVYGGLMGNSMLLSLREVATIASLGVWGGSWANNENLTHGESKEVVFANAVLGREVLAFLPKHACTAGCSGVMLSAGEAFVAPGALYPWPLAKLEDHFESGVLHAHHYGDWFNADDIPATALADPRLFFHTWVEAFMLESVNVLHGDGTPEELFGEGSLLASWSSLQDFLHLSLDE